MSDRLSNKSGASFIIIWLYTLLILTVFSVWYWKDGFLALFNDPLRLAGYYYTFASLIFASAIGSLASLAFNRLVASINRNLFLLLLISAICSINILVFIVQYLKWVLTMT